jgi:hypothetical protein
MLLLNSPTIQILNQFFEWFRAVRTKWWPTIQIFDRVLNDARLFGQNGGCLSSWVHIVSIGMVWRSNDQAFLRVTNSFEYWTSLVFRSPMYTEHLNIGQVWFLNGPVVRYHLNTRNQLSQSLYVWRRPVFIWVIDKGLNTRLVHSSDMLKLLVPHSQCSLRENPKLWKFLELKLMHLEISFG